MLAVREAVKYATAHCRAGQGPFVLEFDTYRYHGHSMSDPGVTYRDRTEVSGVREKRDPVNKARSWLTDKAGMADAELKAIEVATRKGIDAEMAKAIAASAPPLTELYDGVYKDQNPNMFIRGCDMPSSHGDFSVSA